MAPNTKGVSEGLRITDNGGIETDVFLRTSKPDVWAAGDVASYPYWATGENVRVEHHNEAIYQGFGILPIYYFQLCRCHEHPRKAYADVTRPLLLDSPVGQ